MSEPYPNMSQQPVDALHDSVRQSAGFADWDLVVSPRPSVRVIAPLQEGIEEILERLRASDVRREGAMARLEGMLDEWSALEPVSSPEPVWSAGRVSPPESVWLAEPVSLPASDNLMAAEAEEPATETSAVQVTDVAVTPLMAFESESSVRAQTAMFLRAQGLRPRRERQVNQVVAWRPEVLRAGREEPSRPADADLRSAPPRRDVVQLLASRLDALELAIVVVKGELQRTTERCRTLQRRTSVALFIVCVSVVIAGAVLIGADRRVRDATARAAAAAQQAATASRRVGALEESVKQAADTESSRTRK